jgi:hypothetical protein
MASRFAKQQLSEVRQKLRAHSYALIAATKSIAKDTGKLIAHSKVIIKLSALAHGKNRFREDLRRANSAKSPTPAQHLVVSLFVLTVCLAITSMVFLAVWMP